MTIARLIAGRSSEIFGCDVSASVDEAVQLLAEKRIGAVPVFADGQLVGIFSERDVIHQLAAHGPAMLSKPLGEVMTASPVTVEPATDVLAALSLMTQRRFRHLPVVDGDTVCGFISIGDLVKYRIERIEAEAEAMRSYIQSA